MNKIIPILTFTIFTAAATAGQTPYADPSPSPLEGLEYGIPFFPDADHDPDIPDPGSLLGHAAGERAATPEAIVNAVRVWAEASDRMELVHYADSYEGRPLRYVVISDPDNLARIDEIQAGMAALADPRESTSAERARLIDTLPGTAWMGYSIHGNESSGSDAALALIHHFAADRGEATAELLRELVIIIDPDMNPDGRARFTSGVREYRGAQPNVDDQSLVHSGYWPWGRGNHYLFDLNRDWIYAVHPETRGRIRHISRWRPLLFVDAHEMGAQDTYLFSPAREPHNPHFPPYRLEWGNLFADDMARAFDRYGYPYYSGEWHEDWYPGYTDAWASLRGSQGILYEQARLAEDGVQRRGQLISYAQSVHHQVLATMANLDTLRANRETLLRGFVEDREAMIGSGSPYANRSFAIVPGDNHGRMAVLKDLLHIQGFEAFELTDEVNVRRAVDQLGTERNVELPAGTLILPNRQPEARLLAAMFEFDPRLSEQALRNERQRVLKEGRSTIYDTTAWNITMMFGLEAYTLREELTRNLRRVEFEEAGPAESGNLAEDAIALAVSGADDRAPAFAGRLMERGVQVRANDRDSELNGRELPRGSVVITRDDNRDTDNWPEQVAAVAAELGLEVFTIATGRAPGDLPDLGGRHFVLLEKPSIAVIGQGGVNFLDFGSTWFVLDRRLGVRHSHLDENRIERLDLRRYNVLVLPDRWDNALPSGLERRLEEWVRAGGTLIASGASARALAGKSNGNGENGNFLGTRLLDNVLDDLLPYQNAIHREWLAANRPMPEAIWDQAAPAQIELPWLANEDETKEAERKRRDEWQRLFMPSGAIAAARADGDHWLTAGAGEYLPVLYANSPVLMAVPPVEAPLRLGVYREGESEAHHAGWAPVPEGSELVVRMSGLMWPEARQRVASSAWVTRESAGRGQIILFAFPPTFRAAQIGAIRVMENALIYGPAMGATPPIRLP